MPTPHRCERAASAIAAFASAAREPRCRRGRLNKRTTCAAPVLLLLRAGHVAFRPGCVRTAPKELAYERAIGRIDNPHHGLTWNTGVPIACAVLVDAFAEGQQQVTAIFFDIHNHCVNGQNSICSFARSI